MSKVLIEIDIISDVVCPWCVIGFGRLQQALKQLNDKVDAKITWHPFELNPQMPKEGENLRSHLAKKYGTTLEGSIKAREMLTVLGRDIGFSFDYFDDMKMLNTHQCHQLLLWAKDSDKQSQLAMAMFELFFSHQGEFSLSALLKLVESVGLDREQAQNLLESNALSPQVHAIENQWREQGIQGVPAFIFNKSNALVGAQDVSHFVATITSLIEEKAVE